MKLIKFHNYFCRSLDLLTFLYIIKYNNATEIANTYAAQHSMLTYGLNKD